MPLCEKKEPKVLPRKLPESAKSGLSSVPMPLPGRAKEAELGTNEAGMSMPKRESLPNCRDRVQLTPLESARKTRHAAKSPGRAVELVRFVLCIVPPFAMLSLSCASLVCEAASTLGLELVRCFYGWPLSA